MYGERGSAHAGAGRSAHDPAGVDPIPDARALAWAFSAVAALAMTLGAIWMVAAVADEYGSEAAVDFGWSMSRLSVDDVAARPGMFEGRDVAVTGLVKIEEDTQDPLLPDRRADSFELSDDDGPVFNDRVTIVNGTGEPVRVVEDTLVEVQGRVVADSGVEARATGVVIVANKIHREDPVDKLRQTIEPRDDGLQPGAARAIPERAHE